MPISFNNIPYMAAVATQHLQDPNHLTGVLLEEIPSDIGRTYQSYKRGGYLEGIERCIREVMTGATWLGGIIVFNKGFNKLLEKRHIPMDLDFSQETIENVAKYLKDPTQKISANVSELSKYLDWNLDKNAQVTVESLAKNIKNAKTFSTVSSLIINCILMGIAIPKFNQMLTRRRIKKRNAKKSLIKNASFEDFQKKTSKNNNQISFTGNFLNLIKKIPYATENNNTFRLIITDVPIISGRAATSRNKYEALENVVVDGGSIYFYNFCRGHIQKLLRFLTNKMPAMNPLGADKLTKVDESVIKTAMDKVKDADSLKVSEIFDKELSDKIYSYSTFGKFGKLNRFVDDKKIAQIDKEVFNYIKSMAKKIGYSDGREFDMNTFVKKAKLYNCLNGLYLVIGLVTAVWGLSTFLPKLAFRITTLLTGKNEFTGIAKFDDDKKKVKES